MAHLRVSLNTPNLPEPSNAPLEISFRRLLDCTFKHLNTLAGASGTAGSSPAAGGGGDGGGTGAVSSGAGGQEEPTAGAGRLAAASDSVDGEAGDCDDVDSDSDTAALVLQLRHYVDALRDQLADLRAQQEALRLDGALLNLYDAHVKGVATALPKIQLPPYCQKLTAGTAVAATGGGPGGGAGAGSRVAQPNMSYYTPPPAARPSLKVASLPPGRGDPAGMRAVEGLSAAAAERLRGAEAAQALLTGELADLAAALKHNALGLAGAVADRGRLLEATDGALGESLAAAKRNAAEAGAQIKRYGGTLCLTCLVLVLVGGLFSVMVFYIKATQLMGYRSAPSHGTDMQPPYDEAKAGGEGEDSGQGWGLRYDSGQPGPLMEGRWEGGEL